MKDAELYDIGDFEEDMGVLTMLKPAFLKRFEVITEYDSEWPEWPRVTERNVKAYTEGVGKSDTEGGKSLLNAQQELDKTRGLIEEYGGGLRGLGVFLGLWDSNTDDDEDEMFSYIQEESGVNFEGTSWDYLIGDEEDDEEEEPVQKTFAHKEGQYKEYGLNYENKEFIVGQQERAAMLKFRRILANKLRSYDPAKGTCPSVNDYLNLYNVDITKLATVLKKNKEWVDDAELVVLFIECVYDIKIRYYHEQMNQWLFGSGDVDPRGSR